MRRSLKQMTCVHLQWMTCLSAHPQDSSVPVDVETSIFPRQRIPSSPSRSLHSLSHVTSHLDTPTASSQPDLRGVPGQTSLLSLHGSGLAGGPPSQLSAGAHAAEGSLLVEEMQSLHALCKLICMEKRDSSVTP